MQMHLIFEMTKIKEMKRIVFIILVLISLQSPAQTPVNIVPYPVSLEVHEGYFNLNAQTTIVAEKQERDEAEMLNLYMKQLYGITLAVKDESHATAGNKIILKLIKSSGRKDAYDLEVDSKKIVIKSAGNEGLFYGVQTFLQLLPTDKIRAMKFEIPQLSIKDYPRFGYRGMHLDVSRHFFEVDFIKKYLDYMAYHKFNNFHWHLTDDQGWRIEIKKYPNLTSVGGFRNGTIIGKHPGTGNDSIRYGGFYTQEQIKGIVKYAKDRFINVIPEIEMPGHSSAAIAAYPELSCFPDEPTEPASGSPWAGSRSGKQVQQSWAISKDVYCPSEYTFKFLENVLDEVMQLFPSPYIHIGGDECPKNAWKRSAFCQNLIKEKGLKDEHDLQSYFIQRIEKYLYSKGRKIIGWDEILEGGLAPNATVMSWRGEVGGIAAAKQNHNVIMTPSNYCYFNYSQSHNEDSITIGSYLPLDSVYYYEPVPKDLDIVEAKYVLGAQGNLWSEYLENGSIAEYMIFPRMSALSEVLWSPKEVRNWNRFSSAIPNIFKRYQLWGASYSTAYFDLQASVLPSPDFNGVFFKLESKFPDNLIKYRIGAGNAKWKVYNTPVFINSSISTEFFLGGNEGNNIYTKNFLFHKATGKKIFIKDQPAPNFPGSGAFTLVDGSIGTKGLSEYSEWLGFLGKDMEATIDLGSSTSIQSVSLHTFGSGSDWAYLPRGNRAINFPQQISIEVSDDGNNYQTISTEKINSQSNKNGKFTLPVNTTARYLRITAKNQGVIPAGSPGAATAVWLFVSEIEVQ